MNHLLHSFLISIYLLSPEKICSVKKKKKRCKKPQNSCLALNCVRPQLLHQEYTAITPPSPPSPTLCPPAVTAVQQARCVGHGGEERSYPATPDIPRSIRSLCFQAGPHPQCQPPRDGDLADRLLSWLTLCGG